MAGGDRSGAGGGRLAGEVEDTETRRHDAEIEKIEAYEADLEESMTISELRLEQP